MASDRRHALEDGGGFPPRPAAVLALPERLLAETRQNRAGRPGRYVFYLLRGLDTHDLPNGYYRLEVQASDTRGNTATSVLPFRIDNL